MGLSTSYPPYKTQREERFQKKGTELSAKRGYGSVHPLQQMRVEDSVPGKTVYTNRA